jgi:hypothetical protein
VEVEKLDRRLDLIKPDRTPREADSGPFLFVHAAYRDNLLEHDAVVGQA